MVGFVSLMNALAWPAATLVMAILFRREIGAALGRLGHVKYRDLEVNFRDDLRQAEVLAQAIPAVVGPAPAPALALAPGRVRLEAAEAGGEDDLGGMILADPHVPTARHEPPAARGRGAFDRLAARSPRDAVLDAWSEVSQALIRSATALGDRRAHAPVVAEDAARALADRGHLPGPEARLVERLHALRDRAARGDDHPPTADDARRYVDLALPLAARIATLG